MGSRRRITVALVGLIALVLGSWFVKDVLIGEDNGASVAGGDASLEVRVLSSLPAEVADTWQLIQSDGPFPFPNKDGTVFGNREERLPEQRDGYYHEYTVPTPGSADRGARRLITGKAKELYYTQNHYDSFVVVDPAR